VVIDIHGNRMTTQTTNDRAQKMEIIEATSHESPVSERMIMVNGLTWSTRSKTDLTTQYRYDDLGRQTGVVDPRVGASLTHYNGLGQFDYVEDAAGNRTGFSYELLSGQKPAETNPRRKKFHQTEKYDGQILKLCWRKTLLENRNVTLLPNGTKIEFMRNMTLEVFDFHIS
jgi:YD repeat-containing protein